MDLEDIYATIILPGEGMCFLWNLLVDLSQWYGDIYKKQNEVRLIPDSLSMALYMIAIAL